ncbi:MAG TPA: Ku protein [Pirellula sp.]|nr:Ku protein [Pirellula sp.]
MPARSTWRGSIQISGLTISVRVFNAVDRSPDIELHQYHQTCSNRIQFRRVCPLHGPIDSKEIVDGYEYAPDQVVLLSPEESNSILPEDTKVIGIKYFVPKDEYDKVCLSGKHFYIVPDSTTDQRSFVAIQDALTSTNQIAFVTVVLHQSEYIVAIKPLGRLLQLSVIEYPERVREAKDYESEVDRVSISNEEKELATELLSSMRQSAIDLDSFRNPRTLRLSALLEFRVKSDISSRNLDGDSEIKSTDANSIEKLDPHSVLASALRRAIGKAENQNKPKTVPLEDLSGECKKTG